MFALHAAHTDLIPGTPYGPPSTQGVIPEYRVSSQPLTMQKVTPKIKKNKNLLKDFLEILTVVLTISTACPSAFLLSYFVIIFLRYWITHDHC